MGLTRPRRRLEVLNWLPAAIAVLVIATESTSMMSANNTSRWLLPIWIQLFGPITAAHWNVVHEMLRKSGHFIGYGLVSLAFFHGWRSTLRPPPGPKTLWKHAALLAILCTFLLACADETHQRFLPHRGGSPVDVGIDLAGAILAQLLLLAARTRFSRWAVYSSV